MRRERWAFYGVLSGFVVMVLCIWLDVLVREISGLVLLFVGWEECRLWLFSDVCISRKLCLHHVLEQGPASFSHMRMAPLEQRWQQQQFILSIVRLTIPDVVQPFRNTAT